MGTALKNTAAAFVFVTGQLGYYTVGHSMCQEAMFFSFPWAKRVACSKRRHDTGYNLPSRSPILVSRVSPLALPLLGLQVLSNNGLWSGENQVSILPDSALKFCKASFAVTAH